MKLLVLNGPNMNLLGRREPGIYGNLTLDELNREVARYVFDFNEGIEDEEDQIDLYFYQSNHEGILIDAIQNAQNNYEGIVYNPAAHTHYSIAIRDAIASTNLPVVEVHLSDISHREDFRARSVIAEVCIGQVMGKNIDSYKEAIDLVYNYLRPPTPVAVLLDEGAADEGETDDPFRVADGEQKDSADNDGGDGGDDGGSDSGSDSDAACDAGSDGDDGSDGSSDSGGGSDKGDGDEGDEFSAFTVDASEALDPFVENAAKNRSAVEAISVDDEAGDAAVIEAKKAAEAKSAEVIGKVMDDTDIADANTGDEDADDGAAGDEDADTDGAAETAGDDSADTTADDSESDDDDPAKNRAKAQVETKPIDPQWGPPIFPFKEKEEDPMAGLDKFNV